jgi:hypothetical protein
MNPIEILLLLIGAPVFVWVLFRAAAHGWFGEKLRYHRRLVDGIRGETDGQPSGE